MKDPRATIDFETRSYANLKQVGGFAYSKHPSTQAMCMAYHIPTQDQIRLWHPAHPELGIKESSPPEELFEYLAQGGLVEAHNCFFEWAIWLNIMQEHYAWPPVREAAWRCSAAKANALSLPRDLAGACKAINLGIEKDMDGHKLMLQMCKPKARRNSDPLDAPITYHETEDAIKRQWAYCRQDVRAEMAFSSATPDLTTPELELWQIDQRMNRRGAKFDLELARSALIVSVTWKAQLNEKLDQITGITSATKRTAVVKWFAEEEGLELPNTQADTLTWYKDNYELSARGAQVMRIVTDVNRTSTSKYQTMLNRADPQDHRIRDLLTFRGAGTGRWAAKGVQVHNFPAKGVLIKDPEESSQLIKDRDIDWIRLLYGDVMKVLSGSLRGAIIAPEGYDLIVADYAAIEARMVLWLAGAQEALKVFDRGEDIYCDMATGIYGHPVLKSQHPVERQFGKQAILGLGFGMGYITFFLTCRKYGIKFTHRDAKRIVGSGLLLEIEDWVRHQLFRPEKGSKQKADMDLKRIIAVRENPRDVIHELALMKYVVNMYRQKYPEVKTLWKLQEEAAIEATLTRQPITSGKISWVMEGMFLFCQLPSGRRIAYSDAEVKMVETCWGERRVGLRYMSSVGSARKWLRTASYGGKLVENQTQGAACDIMSDAVIRLHKGKIYRPILSIHDEVLAEVREDEGSVPDFSRIMTMKPAWAEGFPCSVDAARFKRYRKI